MGEPCPHHLHDDDQQKEKYLPVDAGTANRASDPAIQAEVDKRGEPPDIFFADELAIQSENAGDHDVERQGEIFMVGQGGNRKDSSRGSRGQDSEKQGHEDDGFEGDVRGEKIRDGDAHPYAQGQRDAEEGEQSDDLPDRTLVLSEKKFLEDARAGERCRNRGGNAQLNQQRDEDQLLGIHAPTVTPARDAKPATECSTTHL